MKAAVVTAAHTPPLYADFAVPQAQPGLRSIAVSAAALSRVTRARASGTHYSSSSRYPFVAGVDGTGCLDDGRRVYFAFPPAPFGAMAEHCVVEDAHCIALPDGLDDVTAAALAIPGMSSYAALIERARFVAGETVLVNGATGSSGRLAVQIAKHLGARKVIATGRNEAVLESLRSEGADATISLTQPEADLERALASHFREGIDVVLDYLWGPSARASLIAAAKALPDGYPLRFVQIGSIGGEDLPLPGAVLRSTAITLLGSGIGSVPMPRLMHALKSVFEIALPARLHIETEAIPLSSVAECWERAESSKRIVLTVAR
ncbi:quinone oxidoreductase family protein [Pararobbsia silviterrae]|uniref:Zinc-binding alcohol dehydrogenase family protein n=1 Tax=Pararobbsia silviterrae TaxID=1792498 RepID=A0A494XCC4_9BURK|nr:zinc-binding alcohol dehydrogenase family protein [Pararobbsia silviterrae]RKP46166.1 zinc-binding alcohol dehydrogenase family protein [Pararobbsia silviterrae]